MNKEVLNAAITCPNCNSKDLWRDGHRMLDDSKVQLWLCKSCSHRFTDPNSRRVCMYKDTESIGRVRGTTGQFFDLLWSMKKQGYSEATIISTSEILNILVKNGVDLSDPESVKEYIALRDDWSEGRKENVIDAYDRYAKFYNIKWDKPRIVRKDKLPFIPLEKEIDDLIAGCSKYVAVALQIGKETGARVGEIFNIRWIDIDFEKRTVVITPEKGSNARKFKISNQLVNMLNRLPRKGEKILGDHYKDVKHLRRTFERQRRRIAEKFGNPRLLKISFHTLRHWKATMEYRKTKDILHVKNNILGHKSIKNTLKYITLANVEEDDEYIVKVAKNIDEIVELASQGFEMLCEHDGFKIMRKRK